MSASRKQSEIMLGDHNRNSSSISQAAVAVAVEPRPQELACLQYNPNRDKLGDIRNALLTIAVLIATATYQAILSPPGGLWEEDENEDDTVHRQIAGASIMITKNYFSFAWFCFFNTLGFFSSLAMIEILTRGCPLQLELNLSMLALCFTYGSSFLSIAPVHFMPVYARFLIIVSAASLPYILHYLKKTFRRS